jgi:hypothetical protein
MKKEYMNPEIRVVLLSVKRPMLQAVSAEVPKSEEEIESADII